MCLTEAHCGTDLGMLRTKAEPQRRRHRTRSPAARSSSRAGEHDLTENIVHLVLARLPDAPRAPKAFRCSSFRSSSPSETARPASATRSFAARSNTRWASTATRPARSTSTARAAGWSASPTWPERDVRDDERGASRRRHAVARPDRGGLSKRLAYAKERLQIRALSGAKAPDKPADPIIVHPDVRKMLLTAGAYAEGGRASLSRPRYMLDASRTIPTKRCARTAPTWSPCSRRS